MVEEGGEEVALQVVDGHEGDVPGQGQRLGLAQPHQEGPDEAGAGGGGHRGQTGGTGDEAGPVEGGGQDGGEELQMGPAGDLGDDPAVGGVEVDLGRHHGRADLAPGGDHGGRRLVARRLDAEEHPGRRW